MPDPHPPTFSVLSPPRHACCASGRCCTGVWVEVDEDEVPRVERAAEALGVRDPVTDGGLRFVEGRCVFLGPDRLCEIHRRFGAEAKPLRCQLFPFVTVRTESGLRAGIDPACATSLRSWRDGPLVQPLVSMTRHRPLHPSQVPAERALIAAASAPGATVAGLLHLLCTGSPGGPALPSAFPERWIARLREVDLEAMRADDTLGPGLRAAVGRLAEGAAGWREAPPWPALGPEEDAFAVEAMRRMLFLRLAPLLPVVQGVALLTLGGAVTAGWCDPSPAGFGDLFTAWCRLVRLRAVWRALAPDPETLRWLATGVREGGEAA